MPFDFHNDDHPEGLASARVRMMQPYAGKGRGMQFPMAKGTEVLLTFVDGDPDRPLIAGAINTAAAPGPVTAGNQTESVIQTGGANKIRMEDKFGSERVMIESPASNSWIRVGATNDPITLHGDSPQYVDISSNGSYSDPKAIATDTDGKETPAFAGVILDLLGVATPMDLTVQGEYIVKYTNTDNSSNDVAYRRVVVRDPDLETDLVASENDGIRLQSAGSLWLEAKSRYGEYYTGKPPKAAKGPAIPEQADMLAKFGALYNPTNLLMHSSQGATTVETTNVAIAKAHVKVSSMDTFTTQEGNIYDFGGYWNYNLGNSYAENHLNQSAILNSNHGKTMEQAGLTDVNVVVGSLGAIGVTVIPLIVAGVSVHVAGGGGATATGVLAGALPFVAVAVSVVTTVLAGVNNIGDSQSIGDVIIGPGSYAINTWANEVPLHTDSTWVDRSFGHSYSYTEGNEIDITHGNKEEHVKGDVYEYKYGGKREETSFTGDGLKTHWASSAKGLSHEANWDRTTGQLIGYEFKAMGHFRFTATLPTLPVLAIDVVLSSVNIGFSFSAGTDIGVSVAAAMSVKADLVSGFSVNFESKFGGEVKRNDVTGSMEFNAFGFTAAKEAALKAKKQELILEKLATKLTSTEIVAISRKMTLEESTMKTGIGQRIYL
jgi:hypothetical protein